MFVEQAVVGKVEVEKRFVVGESCCQVCRSTATETIPRQVDGLQAVVGLQTTTASQLDLMLGCSGKQNYSQSPSDLLRAQKTQRVPTQVQVGQRVVRACHDAIASNKLCHTHVRENSCSLNFN